jgi:hypothetical protein
MPESLTFLNQIVPITSPVGTTVLVGTSSKSAIGPNQTRRGVMFVNPGASVTLYICPANQTAVSGQGVPIAALATVTLNGNEQTGINVTCGWNVIAASSSNNPLTVLELL